jgi:hypothetical protein
MIPDRAVSSPTAETRIRAEQAPSVANRGRDVLPADEPVGVTPELHLHTDDTPLGVLGDEVDT